MPTPRLNKNQFNVSQVHSTYIACAGDPRRTAAALNMDESDVRSMAVLERWDDQVKTWMELRSDSPDIQVQINRAVNFVQAHRLRTILDRVVGHLFDKTPEELVETLTVNTKNGSEFRARPLTDLVKAVEAVQEMTCRALGDRGGESGSSDDAKSSGVFLRVTRAMSAADEMKVDSVGVVKQQLLAESTPKPG